MIIIIIIVHMFVVRVFVARPSSSVFRQARRTYILENPNLTIHRTYIAHTSHIRRTHMLRTYI